MKFTVTRIGNSVTLCGHSLGGNRSSTWTCSGSSFSSAPAGLLRTGKVRYTVYPIVTPRILHITRSLQLGGGTQKQLALLAAGLPRDQFDVHVCALERDHRSNMSSLAVGDVPVVAAGKSWKIDPLAYARLKRLVRKLAPDIVHCWSPTANLYGQTASRAVGVRHTVTRRHRIERSASGFQNAIDRRLVRHADRLVTSSRGISEVCCRRGLPEEKLRVIPNAVEPIQTGGQSKQQLCEQIGISADSRLIVTVGRLEAEKRLKDLIWATDLLKCVRDDAHLLIVGDGPQQWRLERYRRQCEITDRVHFVGRRNDVAQLLPLCDCFWSAGDNAGQSSAVMEAMSAALPVVAADSVGNREVVSHREAGFLVPVGERAAFAKWTNVLLEDRQLGHEMGRRGQQRMRDEFSVQGMVGRYMHLYAELLN